MGARHSHQIHAPGVVDAGDRTNKWGNHAHASPKQRSNKSSTSDNSARSLTTSTHTNNWIHAGVDIHDVYDLHEVIAYGHLGKVQICSRKRRQHSTHTGELVVQHNNNIITKSERTNDSLESSVSNHNTTPRGGGGSYHRLFACKGIHVSRLQPEVQEELLEEVTRIRDLPHHPNIVTLSEVYSVKRELWIVTELCSGGDLHSRMDLLSEMDVVDVLEQVASGILFLHDYEIIHSNLKMENVLYEHVGSNAGVKLIDFGVSRHYGRCPDCRTVCGAEYASAPEVYFENNSATCSPKKSDIWSIGVLAYYMLSGGTYPFGTDRVVDEEKLQTASFDFGEEWNQRGISETARTFCQQCFVLDSEERWTARESLDYVQEWMTTVESTSQPLELIAARPALDVSLRGVQGFHLFGQRRKRLLAYLANTMDKTNLNKLQEIFMDFDSTESGVLSMEQVKRAVKQYCKEEEEESCKHLTKTDMKDMFKGCHQDRSGSIEYVPFLHAVLQMQGMMTHEQLGDALDRADPEDKGLLDKETLTRILGQHGCDTTVVNKVVEESGCEKEDGMVEYDVFLQKLFQDPAEAMNHVNRIVADPMM